MKNNKKSNNKAHRSLKGKWGKVGAPPKATKFPKGAFTMETLVGRNKNQCKLSLYKKVDAKLADHSLIQLKSRKQAGGKVGRPADVFILAENYDASKHELPGSTPAVKTRKPRKARTVAVVETVVPTAPPVPEASPVPATSQTVEVPLVPVIEAPIVNEVPAPVAEIVGEPVAA